MKNYFNEEQIEKLKVAETYFWSVKNLQCKRGTSQQLNQLVFDTYVETTNNRPNINWCCSKCVYDFFLTVANLYYESIENIKQAEEKNIQEQNNNETKLTTVKPKGRPKKKDN